MLKVAVVGAGLCGLILTDLLESRGVHCCLFEARPRAGGRILTRFSEDGTPLDLGPTWFWPHDNPNMVHLAQRLALSFVAQHAEGAVIIHDAHRTVRSNGGNPHGGSYRFEGGAAALSDALVGCLGDGTLQLEHELSRVAHRGTHLELHFETRGGTRVVKAERVVLCLPPRLASTLVSFDPSLPPTLTATLSATATWMASNAKALVGFQNRQWRTQGDSGSAFCSHGVLGEVFDASSEDGAALGAFLRFSAAQRTAAGSSLGEHVVSQLRDVFGLASEPLRGLELQDWARERFTCTAIDVELPLAQPTPPDPLLRLPHWQGRLLFGSTETAERHPGHMEGAAERALELAEHLRMGLPEVAKRLPSCEPTPEVEAFCQFAKARITDAVGRYRQAVQRNLARDPQAELTRTALREVCDALYQEVLHAWEQGKHAPNLTSYSVAPFWGFHEALLTHAVRFNRTSCALRNFPADFQPQFEYLDDMWRELMGQFDTYQVRTAGLRA